MVQGKLPVQGRPSMWIIVGAGEGGLFGHFYCPLSFVSSFSLSLGDGFISTEICLKGPINRKQPTNQQISSQQKIIIRSFR